MDVITCTETDYSRPTGTLMPSVGLDHVVGSASDSEIAAMRNLVVVPWHMCEVVFGAPHPGGIDPRVHQSEPIFRTRFPKPRALRRAEKRGHLYVVLVDSDRVSIPEVIRRSSRRSVYASPRVVVWYSPRCVWRDLVQRIRAVQEA